jgi:hypothetical protein
MWLRCAAEIGCPCYPWFVAEPLLDPLLQVPPFTALLERLGEERERERQWFMARVSGL